ncbi:iron-sulfur cluster repair di-iron protein [Ravibacter arvi]|uniref:Iron-sulfur cluster repair di-iron protein n=1 Tax=Ravibacter arvi TaxID=2051041 RepID=A0ABP8M719_9BACT
MNIHKDSIIGELVAEDYRTAAVFKRNGIDFCCNGNRSIGDACSHKQLEATALIRQLEAVGTQKSDGSPDFNSWPLDLLADYVEKKHHRYVEAKIEEIRPFLSKVALVHGDRHPELFEVEQLFEASAGELAVHMKKEELMLFPYIRKMVSAAKSGIPVQAVFGSVQNPIGMMIHEHDTEGARFRRIAELTRDYTPPADGCNTYRVTLSLLKEFEDDLHLHIHLENNILFPKSVELEEHLHA